MAFTILLLWLGSASPIIQSAIDKKAAVLEEEAEKNERLREVKYINELAVVNYNHEVGQFQAVVALVIS